MPLPLQIGLVAAFALILAAGWYGLQGAIGSATPDAAPHSGSKAATVLIEALEYVEDRVSVKAIGSGEALRSASIFSKVSGEVVEVLFVAGQFVKKGEPLVRLDDKHERLAVQLAQVAANDAKRTSDRLEQLAPKGAVSVASLQTAQAELESARVRLAQSMAELEDRTVFAPFDGVIGLTEIEEGDRVTEDSLIGNLDDRSVILVEFAVPEEYANRLAIGGSVALRPWTMPDRELQGTLFALNSRVDRATRSLEVKARIENTEDILRPGMSFDVQLDFSNRSYPAIREVAVLWSRDGAYVWRVNGGRAEKVLVKVVRRNDGRVLVDGPLAAGDLIVVEGVQGLRERQEVTIAPFEPADGGSG